MTDPRGRSAVRERIGRRRLWGLGLLALVSVGSPDASAQTLGVRGGVDFSTVQFEDETSTSAGIGWTVGGTVVFGPRGKIRVGVETLLTERRTTIEEVVEDVLTYVEVPLLARVLLVGGVDDPRVTVAAGAVPRVLVRARETVGGSTFDIKETLASSDVGIAVGADIRVLRRLDASVRYIHGLSGVYSAVDGSALGTLRSLQVGATYWLR